ncbi:MAG: YHS domain-containing protein [Deltaproteobacteria bacterium]|nr:MAG: YHS domain-containing protein [Deltaproteobacteria bacterium]
MILGLTFALALPLWTGCKKKTKKPDPRKTEARGKAPARAKAPTRGKAPARTAASTKVKDLVCGMTVDTKTVKHKHTHDGKTYYFCNAGCMKAFTANPGKYLAKAKPKTDTK